MNQRRNWTNTAEPVAGSKGQLEWQKASTKRSSTRALRYTGVRASFFFLLMLLGLLAFVLLLPYSPDRTPCFVISESNYEIPWDINGWATEDVSQLRRLDGKSLDLIPIQADVNSNEARLKKLEAELERNLTTIRSTGLVTFYINCNGMVNDDGEPCIIFREQSPFQPEAWLTVQRLAETVERMVPPGTHKVFIIDGQRFRSDWQVGVSLNDFTVSLEKMVEGSSIENLSVMTSCGAGERARANSPFAKLLTIGLGGVADGESSQLLDGRVSIDELHTFVSRELLKWSQVYYREQQTSKLFSNVDLAPQLSLCLAASDLEELGSEIISTTTESLLLATDLDRQWQRFLDLPKEHLLAIDPLLYADMERKLLRLEGLAMAGPAMRPYAQKELNEFIKHLDVLSRIDATSLGATWEALADSQSDSQSYFFEVIEPHSIATGRFFGTLSDGEADEIVSGVRRLTASSKTTDAAGEATINLEDAYAEVRLAQMIIDSGANRLWSETDAVEKVLDLQDLSNQLSVPSNLEFAPGLRAHRMLRNELAAVDTQRRTIEDQLFIGPQESQLLASTPGVEVKFAELRGKMDSLAAAWQVSDRLNAELLYYLMWLADPFWEMEDTTDIDLELLRDVVEQLVEDAVDINRFMAAMRPETPFTRAQYEDKIAASTANLETLKLKLLDHTSRLLAANPPQRALHEIELVLKIPFLPVQVRSDLRKQYFKLVEVNRADNDETRNSEQVEGAAEVGLSYETRVASAAAGWGPIWATRLLVWSEPLADLTIEDSADAAVRLANFERTLAQHRRYIVSSNSTPWTESNTNLLPELTSAAHTVRSSSPLWFHHDQSLNRDMHFVYVQELLRDLAARSLSDCWGKTASDSSTYFKEVVRDYLQAAKSLKSVRGAEPINFDFLESLAEQRDIFLQYAVTAVAADKSLAPGIGPLEIEAKIAVNTLGERPIPGRAAVFARDADGNRRQLVERSAENPASSASTPSISFPPESPTTSLLLGDGEGAAPPGRYEFVTYFRGNEVRASFGVLGDSGRSYTWETTELNNATIDVQGSGVASPSLIFILDCSESMSERMLDEFQQPARDSKLELATSSLLRMLGELTTDKRNRVGVVLFGHRLSWSTTEPLRVLIRPELEHLIPASLTPSTDVELILPLGRFDTYALGDLRRELESLVPWGQSPLYLAIEQAVSEFYGKAEKSNSAIVVITDGMNYQFTPPNSTANNASPVSEPQLLRELKAAGIPVHVLGFFLPENNRAAALEQFEQIAKATGGSFSTADGEKELLRLLQERIGAAVFTVGALPETNTSATWSSRLNQAVKVSKNSASQQFRVEFENARTIVDIEGGEALQMQYLQRGDQFAPIPYDRDFPALSELVGPGETSRDLVFRGHRPQKSGDSVSFRVSVQSAIKPFTQRPQECWLEIEPCDDNGERLADPYIYYDPVWQEGVPVPVLSWTASNWPQDSRKATLRFHCKYGATPPRATKTVKSIANNPVTSPQALEEFAGLEVAYRMQDQPSAGYFELDVIEVHSDLSSGVGSLRVNMIGSRTPTKTTRYFDRKSGFALHRFQFPLQSKRDVTRSSQIQFFRKEDVLENSFHLDGSDGMLIDIFAKDALLPFNSAEIPLRTVPSLPEFSPPKPDTP